jgi:hypothetical protein
MDNNLWDSIADIEGAQQQQEQNIRQLVVVGVLQSHLQN